MDGEKELVMTEEREQHVMREGKRARKELKVVRMCS